MKKSKIALLCVLVLAVVFGSLLFGTDLLKDVDFITPYLQVVPDAAEMGIDYISLERGKNTVTAKELETALTQAVQNVERPFVLANAREVEKAKLEFESDKHSEYTAALCESVLSYADELCDLEKLPLLKYELDEEDAILEICREAKSRMIILGTAWQLTGDEKYAERAWLELENVCGFEDWCPSHFLDTAEMALAVSIGFDWFFDYLTEAQKQLIADTVFEYAVTPALSKNYLKNWFTWSKTNWNSICYSGVGTACMTFCEYNMPKACEFLAMAYKNMPIAFEAFTPDGVYVEGSGYWESGTSALVYFIATSRNYFGTDYGLSEIDGFAQLGDFPIYVTTPVGVFNYGDNKDRIPTSPILHWYAAEYESPLLSCYQMVYTDLESYGYGACSENALSLMWYNREYTAESADFSAVPLNAFLDSDNGEELVVMRSAYLDKNATYAAIKGSYNYTNHGDLDVGTFLFDALGERWAEELGPGSYDAPGYFTGLAGMGRWKNYCKRAEGQNTLVINPDVATEDQYAFATCSFTSFEETDDGAKAVLDMTKAYSLNHAKSVVREFEIFNNSSSLRITDTVEAKINSEIYWFMHTKAEIDVADDGKTALLTIGDKAVKATLHTDGEFSVMKAEALRGAYEYDADYVDIQKLTVHLENIKNTVIEVTLEPIIKEADK